MINFNAGPAAMPQIVKEAYAQAVMNVPGTPWSLLELPHRSAAFIAVIEESKAILKRLLTIPDQYDILWMQGGGRHQFGLIPMNFLGADAQAAYVNSGHWAKEALQYATYYGSVDMVASSESEDYRYYPTIPPIQDTYSYLHLTTNNTIYGTQITALPSTKVPIIADMSSDILSRHIDVSQYAMIYAAAQKNIGPAGATLVIIDKAFAQNIKRPLPSIYTYESFIKSNSVFNTAPVSAIYASLLNLRYWDEVGMASIAATNDAKAAKLYGYLQASPHFELIPTADYSKMNVCFRLLQYQLTDQLIDFAAEHGIIGIDGHRSIGGFRVSLYNTITLADVNVLIDVLNLFSSKYLD